MQDVITHTGKPIVVVGSLNQDLTFDVPRLPVAGETMTATASRRTPGGKGANQAVAAGRLGAAVHMIGALGSDDAATMLRATLGASHVETGALVASAEPTGTAIILLTPAGENSIVLAPGANHTLAPGHLEARQQLIGAAALILTQLETPLATLAALLAIAEQRGIPVMLDPAPAQPLSRAILEQITWFTPNQGEASFYAEGGSSLDDAKARCEHLQSLGPKNILLKLGERGAAVLTEQGEWLFAPAPTVTVVDTVGAGDTLNAAFATALTRGDSLADALHFAVAAAALSVTRSGAMDAAPWEHEVSVARGS